MSVFDWGNINSTCFRTSLPSDICEFKTEVEHVDSSACLQHHSDCMHQILKKVSHLRLESLLMNVSWESLNHFYLKSPWFYDLETKQKKSRRMNLAKEQTLSGHCTRLAWQPHGCGLILAAGTHVHDTYVSKKNIKMSNMTSETTILYYIGTLTCM